MGAQQEVEGLLERIRAVSNSPVIERCSDQIQVLCSSYMEPDINTEALAIGLHKNRAKIFDLLHTKLGQVVSRQALMNAMYPTDNSPETGENVLKVQIWHVRKAAKRSGYQIETIWGSGYRMTKAAA